MVKRTKNSKSTERCDEVMTLIYLPIIRTLKSSNLCVWVLTLLNIRFGDMRKIKWYIVKSVWEKKNPFSYEMPVWKWNKQYK